VRRFASFVALALLLASVVAPLADACPCREAEAQASHSCCEEAVLRPVKPGCCALLGSAAESTPTMQPAPFSADGVLVASTSITSLPVGDAVDAVQRLPLRSPTSPPSVLRL
jgi:hypothetical protein